MDSRKVAKDKAIVATETELAEIEGYLLGQGWIVIDEKDGAHRYAVTRHGLDEAQRKLPAEAKIYTKPEDVG